MNVHARIYCLALLACMELLPTSKQSDVPGLPKVNIPPPTPRTWQCL